MNKTQIKELYTLLSAERPDPKSELNFSTPFELLVAVMLSAQATDKSVNLATEKLFADANTPQAILALGQEGLENYIRTIGLYRSKAKHVLAACKILCEKYSGSVPRDYESLVSLPGVGSKTAKVVLNVAFGEPTIAVDTHIFRVANRTGLAPGNSPDEVSEKLSKVTPPEFLKNAHHWLLLHGRYCCKARKPLCSQCPISHLCTSDEKTL
jgi:endonuclease-3